MKIELSVTYNDGTKRDVNAVFSDFVAFERTWNRSVTKFEEELRLTDLAWIAWHSEKRTKNTASQFEPDWIDTVAEIDIRTEDGNPVPLV
jgi:hypothetical protein